MNHPDSGSSAGYDFIGYDFTNSFFGAVDTSVCAELVESTGTISTVCGAIVADSTGILVGGDHTASVGSLRPGAVTFRAKRGRGWYEDEWSDVVWGCATPSR